MLTEVGTRPAEHAASASTLETVDPQLLQRVSNAFGNDWRYFPEDEQARICAVIGSIPPLQNGTRRKFDRAMLEHLVEIMGLCAYRGINAEPISTLTGNKNSTSIRLKIDTFNKSCNADEKLEFLNANEVALLAEIERRLISLKQKAPWGRTKREQEERAFLATTWVRLQRKAGFTHNVSGDIRGAAGVSYAWTRVPDQDNSGTSFVDLLPDDLRAILHPEKERADADVSDVATSEEVVIEAAKELAQRVAETFPEAVTPEAQEPPAEMIHARPPAVAAQGTLSPEDRAFMEQVVAQGERFAAILESVEDENSEKAKAAASMVSVHRAFADRMGGNSQKADGPTGETPRSATARDAVMIGGSEIHFSPETLRQIENGSLEVHITVREILMKRPDGEPADTPTA